MSLSLVKLVKDLEIQRDQKNRGHVNFDLLYYPNGMNNGLSNPFSQNESMTSLESVLKNSEEGKEVSPNGSEINNRREAQINSKTRVVNKSLNLVWNHTFDFVVEDRLYDMLMLEVWDHDTFGKDFMGKCILTLPRVLMEGEYKDSYELADAKSGKLNLHLK
ncbi:hypothetical protein MTR67_026355 [Solanum verrucosum]|uniref:C2 domain-containing protein n=1 Tax=Solanum verrucosum TaxID=315347 RepID=A0AAF0R5C7_SOLVR|nr:hypothetical protein MTR67_026355 [Solanum verrucosum]